MSNQPAARHMYNVLLQSAIRARHRNLLISTSPSIRPSASTRFENTSGGRRSISCSARDYELLRSDAFGATDVERTPVSLSVSKSYTSGKDFPGDNDGTQYKKKSQSISKTRQTTGRTATLYEALVRPSDEDISPLLQNRTQNRQRSTPRHQMPLALSLSDGTPISKPESDQFVKQLRDCVAATDAQRAIHLLQELRTKHYTPTARAVILVIDACVAANQLDYGEHALAFLHSTNEQQDSTSTHPDNSDGFRAARTVLAVAYTSKGAFEQAAHTMGLFDWRELSDFNTDALSTRLSELQLGTNAVSWGVIVKVLTKLQQPEAAVSVVDAAMRAGVGMTDSFLHLTVDALRGAGKWREAVWIFNRACEKGLQPHERTIASVLLAMSSKQARVETDPESIHHIVQKARDPSPKFMLSALMALSSVGHVEPCERLFDELGACNERGVASELAFSCMMAAYVNVLQQLSESEDDVQREKTYVEMNGKSDELWRRYLTTYRLVRPTGSTRSERNSMLIKYLMVKTRSFRTEEAVEVLEQIAFKRHLYPWMEIQISHVTMVMGAVELCCDVNMLNRLLEVMRSSDLVHDMRSLGFAVGTLVSDGDLTAALQLVRAEFALLLARRQRRLDASFRRYHPALLLRRLELLASGFEDVGVGRVPDLDTFLADLKLERASSNVAPQINLVGTEGSKDSDDTATTAKKSQELDLGGGTRFDFDPTRSKNR